MGAVTLLSIVPISIYEDLGLVHASKFDPTYHNLCKSHVLASVETQPEIILCLAFIHQSFFFYSCRGNFPF
jgi:hypothetical protein